MHGHTETDDGRRHRTGAAPPHPHAVADRADPVVPVEDSGRDRDRPAVLPGGVLRGHPAGQRRGAGRAAGPLARRGPARRADPAARLVDRRRPRRQPERHRRRGPAGHRQRRVHRAGALLRRTHRAGAGAVDVGAAGQGQRRAGRAGRCVPRAGPRRRAVPARVAGRSTAGSPRPRPKSWTVSREHELDLGLRAHTARRPSCWPTSTSSTRRCARNGSARAGRRSAGPVAGSRARLRVSLVRPGYAAELRRARGGGRRAAGLGGCAPRLPVAARARTASSCWPPNSAPAGR